MRTNKDRIDSRFRTYLVSLRVKRRLNSSRSYPVLVASHNKRPHAPNSFVGKQAWRKEKTQVAILKYIARTSTAQGCVALTRCSRTEKTRQSSINPNQPNLLLRRGLNNQRQRRAAHWYTYHTWIILRLCILGHDTGKTPRHQAPPGCAQGRVRYGQSSSQGQP